MLRRNVRLIAVLTSRPKALQYLQGVLNKGDWSGVSLEHRPANNFEGIEHSSFDTLVVNSVIQYFPSIDYLAEVLEKAVERIAPGGRLFVGDVRSLSAAGCVPYRHSVTPVPR